MFSVFKDHDLIYFHTTKTISLVYSLVFEHYYHNVSNEDYLKIISEDHTRRWLFV